MSFLTKDPMGTSMFYYIPSLFMIFSTALAQDSDSDSDSDSGDGETKMTMIVMAHAIIACLVWVIVLPTGAILMRLLSARSTVWLHAGTQILGWALFTAAFGMGIWLAMTTEQLMTPHAIIGIVLFSVLSLQPALGFIHHIFMRRSIHHTKLRNTHVWLGRCLITLGMINGGLGLMLADDSTRSERIAYGVVAAVIWLSYMVVGVTTKVRSRHEGSRHSVSESEAGMVGESKHTHGRI